MGSQGDDRGAAIAVDADGNVCVAGNSFATWGSPINLHAGGEDAFAVKLDSNGAMQWNTFMGSQGDDRGAAIAIDADGNACVAGNSFATWGSPVNSYAGGKDAFVTQLDSGGILQWNTFMGSQGDDHGAAIAVDADGNVCVAGNSFATWGSPVNSYAGGKDAFVAQLDSGGTLQWNTFMGSQGDDHGAAIAVDGSGDAFIAGTSYATWGSPPNLHAGGEDAFAAKLGISGVLQWNTFMGSSDNDYGYGIAVDWVGNVYVAGTSYATWGSPIDAHSGSTDAFAAHIYHQSEPSTLDVTPNYLIMVEGHIEYVDVSGGTGVYSVSSSDSSVATATVQGYIITITATGPGNATIAVTDTSTNSAVVSVMVTADPSIFRVTPTSLNLSEGQSGTLTISGGASPYTAVSSDISMADVVLNGDTAVVTGVAEGPAIITVTDKDFNSITVSVTVTYAIAVTPPTLSITEGDMVTVSISGGESPYSASSSNTSVATASVSGSTVTITGNGEGAATVTVTDNNSISASISVTVSALTPLLSISPSSIDITEGDMGTVSISGGESPYGASSSNTSVATASVSGSTVTITGNGEGAATVTVTDNNFSSASISVTISALTLLLSVSPSSIGITEGDTDTVSISGGESPYSASSSNISVATASVSGGIVTITGTGEGSATVTVTDNNFSSASISVTVSASIQPLSVTPSNLTITEGNTGHLRITGGTGFYRVSSSETSIVTAVLGGAVSGETPVSVIGKSEGTATVIITDANYATASSVVTVSPMAKAIVVAGGGPYAENSLWNITKTCADYAVKVLYYQGYTNDTVYYLSSENGSEVDGATTTANLVYAITEWAQNANDLLIYVTGHGGYGYFRVDEAQIVYAWQLDYLLDQIQQIIPGRATVIYDACQSGSFLGYLVPPTGKERVIATSASQFEEALFAAEGQVSFSYLFWSSMFTGASFHESFVQAADSIGVSYNQTPLLDANGNGIGNEGVDTNAADNIQIGNEASTAGDIPFIASVSPHQELVDVTSALVYAQGVVGTDGIGSVFAVITPPDYTTGSPDIPAINLPILELIHVDDSRYEGTYMGFTTSGTYNIAIYATDVSGVISLPEETQVTVTIDLWSGATDLGDGWKYLDWFGSFWVDENSPWIYHSEHGWVYAHGKNTSDIWFYTIELDWFWTSAMAYPMIYVSREGIWTWELWY
ncbi:MAG: SBBP repeat-containing protein [Thermodesulfobacteriota bacterium]|nr:SBBP repeat-containing protein [Thermodesulfobacteriota bacterium]